MKKRRNPFLGVTRVKDRHGKMRWRFRKAGRPSCYINERYNSPEFIAAYEQAMSSEANREKSIKKSKKGTFSWLIEHYYLSSDYARIGPVFKKNLRNQLERFREAHGEKRVAHLKYIHVKKIVGDKYATPAAANELLKLVRRLCGFAIIQGVIKHDPSKGLKPFKTNKDGYYTWTYDDADAFEAIHGLHSKAVLAFRLMRYTGAARQDVAAMGWQNIQNGRISYRRHKTGVLVDLPIMPQLAEVLSLVPRDRLLFLTHSDNAAYKPETLGMWFADQCKRAGVVGRAHGVRKLGATDLANHGATTYEIMTFLGHTNPSEAIKYTNMADRVRLANSGMAKLSKMSTHSAGLDNSHFNPLKSKGK